MKSTTGIAMLAAAACLGACAQTGTDPRPADRGIEWVRDAAEFRALSLQAYRQAGRDLERKLADTAWSALPDQDGAETLSPAVILDVDETAITNAHFQAALVPPFSDEKLNRWGIDNVATAVPGAVAFVQQAADAGVAVYFVTNRSCAAVGDAPCPQEQVVIGELREAGFPAGPDSVMLSGERPEWTKEKSIRRRHIAADHRVIMLFGDDLGDFIDCTRKSPLAPCTDGATRRSRHADVEAYADYWGNGWYVLPNPMHGSWTSVDRGHGASGDP